MASLALLYFISVEKVTNRVITTHYLLETHPAIWTPQSHLLMLERSLSNNLAHLLPSQENEVSLFVTSLSFSLILIEIVVSSYEKVSLSLGPEI